MSTLADQIDRLSRHTKSIYLTASQTALPQSRNQGVAGPFTRAVLHTPLGDLIRDIDPSELGLFNLVNPPNVGRVNQQHRDSGTASLPEITRVEFHGATPLRKQVTSRKEEAHKPKEIEPEVYAQAALKYIDR